MNPKDLYLNDIISVPEKSGCTAHYYSYKNRKYNYHLIILDDCGEIVYHSDIVAVTDDCLKAIVDNLVKYWNEKISAE
jgi:hypothetical protein